MQTTVERRSFRDPLHGIDADATDIWQHEGAEHVYLLVRGMRCPTCAMRVRNALPSVKGVLGADVLLDKGVARVRYDAAQVHLGDLPTAVTRAGGGGPCRYAATVLASWT